MPAYIRMVRTVGFLEMIYCGINPLVGRPEADVKASASQSFRYHRLLHALIVLLSQSTWACHHDGIVPELSGEVLNPPTATWATWYRCLCVYLLQAPWLAMIPGICIILIISF